MIQCNFSTYKIMAYIYAGHCLISPKTILNRHIVIFILCFEPRIQSKVINNNNLQYRIYITNNISIKPRSLLHNLPRFCILILYLTEA